MCVDMRVELVYFSGTIHDMIHISISRYSWQKNQYGRNSYSSQDGSELSFLLVGFFESTSSRGSCAHIIRSEHVNSAEERKFQTGAVFWNQNLILSVSPWLLTWLVTYQTCQRKFAGSLLLRCKL